MATISADIPPNQTLYLQNLNEKLKIDMLKKELHSIFSQFGEIMEISAKKSLQMRGQAFIVYKDVSGATNALKNLNNFPFYGKPIRMNYAKSKSDVVARLDGTYVERPKTEKRKKPEGGEKKPKRQDVRMKAYPTQPPISVSMADAPVVPHHTLFVQNLPEETDERMLAALFGTYQGFKEARTVPGRPGVAFVEFESETQSGVALAALNGFLVTNDRPMRVTYAKR